MSPRILADVRGGLAAQLGILVLVAAAVATAAVLVFDPGRDREPPPGTVAGDPVPLPGFALLDQSGERFGLDRLEDRVWIADFFFTRCRGICPILTERMAALRDRLPAEASWHLVSISVDPVYDTPEILGAYAAERGIDTGRWTFLTGERAEVHELIERGFLLAVESTGPEEEPIVHSQKLVLVDRGGQIRGFYDAFDDEAMEALASDALRLLRSS